MKKKSLFAPVAAFAMGVLLVGCIGGPAPGSPTQVATDFIKAVKAQDAATMAKYYDGEIDEGMFDMMKILEDEDVSPAMQAAAKKLADKVADFDFKVSNEKIEGDKAHVDVEVKTYNFGSFFSDVFSDVVGSAFTMALAGGDNFDETQIESVLLSSLNDNMDKLKEKSYTTTVPLYLTKTSDGWKVQELDDNFMDAVLGGLISTLGDFLGTLGGLDGSESPFDGYDLFGDSDGYDLFGDSSPFDSLGSLDSLAA